MSNEIQPGKLGVNPANTNASESVTNKKSGDSAAGNQVSPATDQVSMTDDVSRLKEIEGMFKNMPKVNENLVREIGVLMAEGRLEINLERTASRLLEAEAGISDPNK